jgi:death-on-curing protein
VAEYIYLTLAEVGQMHRELIDEFGGSHGLRDRAALEAAVFRPQNGYYNGLAEEAAALMESLANNHPFIDGNKRIAFAATDTFLARNGFFLDVEPLDTYRFIMGSLEKSTFRFTSILDWINATIKPVS